MNPSTLGSHCRQTVELGSHCRQTVEQSSHCRQTVDSAGIEIHRLAVLKLRNFRFP